MSQYSPKITDEQRQELLALLENYERTSDVPTTEECLVLWRQEWRMSMEVYGGKVLARKKGTKKYRDALADFCKRMVRVKRIGELLRERINLDGQQKLFDQ